MRTWMVILDSYTRQLNLDNPPVLQQETNASKKFQNGEQAMPVAAWIVYHTDEEWARGLIHVDGRQVDQRRFIRCSCFLVVHAVC